MDVNLTISLMRGQMGVVIEKAVNAAVETVLGEMIRVMSLKFEQLRRELTTKEKENEDIRKMLESTRCQMKVLRQKYVNALNTKDDRHAPHRQTLGQINAARQAAGHLDASRHSAGHLDASRQAAGHLDASRQAAGHLDASRQAAGHLDANRQAAGQLDTTRAHQVTPDHGLPLRRRSSNTGSPSAEPLTLSLKPRNPDPAHTALPVPKTHKVTHEPVPTESCENAEMHNEEVPELKLHLGLKVENTCSLAQESSDPLWGQTPQKITEAEHTEVTDPNLLPVAHTSEALNPAITDTSQPVLKIKQEEAEVEIVEVKEEQAEPSTSELPKIELHQHLAGVAIELPVPQQCVQIPSGTEPAFMGVDPSACLDRLNFFLSLK